MYQKIMINEFIRDLPMDSDYESEWIPVFQEEISGYRKSAIAQSVQITWNNADGLLDGRIDIIASNNMVSSSVGTSLFVTSVSNISNSEMLVLNPLFLYIKIKYTANNITNGYLSANIFYV
jgi:hypothetical protein